MSALAPTSSRSSTAARGAVAQAKRKSRRPACPAGTAMVPTGNKAAEPAPRRRERLPGRRQRPLRQRFHRSRHGRHAPGVSRCLGQAQPLRRRRDHPAGAVLIAHRRPERALLKRMRRDSKLCRIPRGKPQFRNTAQANRKPADTADLACRAEMLRRMVADLSPADRAALWSSVDARARPAATDTPGLAIGESV